MTEQEPKMCLATGEDIHIKAIKNNLNRMVNKLVDDTDYYDCIYHLEQLEKEQKIYVTYNNNRKMEQEPKTDIKTRILSRMWNCRSKNTLTIDKVKMETIIREEFELQEPKTGWIPVSERLPEEGEEVLISGYDTYNKRVIISRYQGEQYGFTCGLVSAWMPLPEPYQSEVSE